MKSVSKTLLRRAVIGLSIAVIVGGCASEPRSKAPVMSGNVDTSSEVSQLESNLEKARRDHVDFLAPKHFLSSQESLQKAKGLQKDTDTAREVTAEVQKGQSELDRANEIASNVKSTLAPVLTARADAISGDAHRLLKDEFKDADKNLLSMGMTVEDGGRISEADRGRLIQKYRNLQVKGVLQGNLGDALKEIQVAKDEGAEKWAPKTLLRTEKRANELQSIIKLNPKNQDLIAKYSQEVKRQADMLLRVTRQSKMINSRNPEDTALRMESQNKNLAELKKEAETTGEELNRQKEELASLEQERSANLKFKQLTSMFSPKEADVFRTENQIVIRLKGLNFSPARATIPGKNYALLNKVADALKDFEGSKVVVEGHTDAKGSAKANQRVSQQRAEAVKDYLVANQAVPESNISAEGKGASEPVASNQTKVGRALNRRVDVVIEAA